MAKLLDILSPPASAPVAGAFQRMVEADRNRDPQAHDKVVAERAEALRVAMQAIVDALVARGGRAAPEPLRIDVKATPYTHKLALERLAQEGVVERASDGSWRGGDWRLTDAARAALIEQGREIPPELDRHQRRAAALAERVLDGLRGEGGGVPPPVLSMQFLRNHTGCGWEALSAALDAIESAGRITRVWSGARLRGVRLAIPDSREAVVDTAQQIAPALAQTTPAEGASPEDRRVHTRVRLAGDLLGVLARSAGPVTRNELTAAVHVGPDLLRQILDELAADGAVVQRWRGAKSAGWEITEVGRSAVVQETTTPERPTQP